MGERSPDQVLGSAAERHENMMVVGINGGTTPRQVGQDRDALVFEREFPALGVVAGRCQRTRHAGAGAQGSVLREQPRLGFGTEAAGSALHFHHEQALKVA